MAVDFHVRTLLWQDRGDAGVYQPGARPKTARLLWRIATLYVNLAGRADHPGMTYVLPEEEDTRERASVLMKRRASWLRPKVVYLDKGSATGASSVSPAGQPTGIIACPIRGNRRTRALCRGRKHYAPATPSATARRRIWRGAHLTTDKKTGKPRRTWFDLRHHSLGWSAKVAHQRYHRPLASNPRTVNWVRCGPFQLRNRLPCASFLGTGPRLAQRLDLFTLRVYRIMGTGPFRWSRSFRLARFCVFVGGHPTVRYEKVPFPSTMDDPRLIFRGF